MSNQKSKKEQNISFPSTSEEDEDSLHGEVNRDDGESSYRKYRENENEDSDNDFSPINNWLKKKNNNRISSSESGESGESDESDEENETRHSTNASSEFGVEHSQSNNGIENSADILADNSVQEQSASTSTQNSKFEESVFIPDSDDEEEDKLFQEAYHSPKSRRSMTGRRSIAPGRLSIAPTNNDIVENSNEEGAEDDDFFIMNSSKDGESLNDKTLPDDQIDLSSIDVDSFGLEKSDIQSPVKSSAKRNRSTLAKWNGSLIRTPKSKRCSLNVTKNDTHLTTSSIANNKSDYMDLTKMSDEDGQTGGISIQSSSSTDESKNTNSRSSIIELDSDDSDDEYVPDIKDISDFGKNTQTSTPGPSKKLVQPKINNAMKIVKFVSREHYEKKEREINAVTAELKGIMDLYNEMKDSLVDNGAKLLNSAEVIKHKVRNMETELAEFKIEEDNIEEVQAKIVEADDWRAGINQIQPKYTGKIGMNTHNVQKALTINRLEKLHKALQLCPGDDELATPPPHLKVSLMPHQLHAIKWMRWREKLKPKGGILADDMGLGKTLTVVALVLDAIYGVDDDVDTNEKENDDEQTDSDSDDDDDVDRVHKHKSNKNGGTLIVCPASLVNQWNHEIQTRVKHNKLVVLMHHGNNRKTNLNMICKNDIVLTTYGVISSEHKNNGALYRIKWDRIVLDEAHMIRNHTTSMSKAASELRANIRWGLTGTPIQNKAMDIFAMMKFLRVKPFNDLQTFKKFSDPRSAEGMRRLHNILKPLLLRRTKAELQIKGELAALPAKTINIEEIDLSNDESSVYMHVLAYSQEMLVKYVANHQARQSGLMGDGAFELSADVRRRIDKIKRTPFHKDVKVSDILVLMLRLRQICDHPGLIKNMLNEDDLDEEEIAQNNSVDMNMMKALIGLDINDTEADAAKDLNDSIKLHNILSRNNPVYNLNNPSSKCKRVIEMVARILKETKDKVVIVSQWTSVLNIVADQLRRKGIHFVELNGKTPIKTRNDIVVSFNQPHTCERIMLLSLVAGGVGLNLTGANHLLLLDPHWNPQLESQAFDRVYRVGQMKDVQIYKLLCNNTIEKRIQEIQTNKLELSDNVLTGSKMNSGSKLSFQDMCTLFEIGK